MSANLNDPKAISEAGERIYASKYKTQYEQEHVGEFVAINVVDESATLGVTATDALVAARDAYPNGVFHLIRVGHTGAFEVGLAYRHVHADRVHR